MESENFSDRRNFKLYGFILYSRAYFMPEHFGNDVRGDVGDFTPVTYELTVATRARQFLRCRRILFSLFSLFEPTRLGT